MKKHVFEDEALLYILYIKVNKYRILMMYYKLVILLVLSDCVKEIRSLFMMSHCTRISWELKMYNWLNHLTVEWWLIMLIDCVKDI